MNKSTIEPRLSGAFDYQVGKFRSEQLLHNSLFNVSPDYWAQLRLKLTG